MRGMDLRRSSVSNFHLHNSPRLDFAVLFATQIHLWSCECKAMYTLLARNEKRQLKFEHFPFSLSPPEALVTTSHPPTLSQRGNKLYQKQYNEFSNQWFFYRSTIISDYMSEPGRGENSTCKINLKFIFSPGFRSLCVCFWWNLKLFMRAKFTYDEWKWKQNIVHCYFNSYYR
jgi:hypothetical protein